MYEIKKKIPSKDETGLKKSKIINLHFFFILFSQEVGKIQKQK